jgi:hypothetical protein
MRGPREEKANKNQISSRLQRARATCFIVAMGLIALESDSLRARGLLDVNDPAFVGSVVVTLPGVAVPAGATSFQFTSNGVTFRRPSLSNRLPRRSADAHAASFCDRLLRD